MPRGGRRSASGGRRCIEEHNAATDLLGAGGWLKMGAYERIAPADGAASSGLSRIGARYVPTR